MDNTNNPNNSSNSPASNPFGTPSTPPATPNSDPLNANPFATSTPVVNNQFDTNTVPQPSEPTPPPVTTFPDSSIPDTQAPPVAEPSNPFSTTAIPSSIPTTPQPTTNFDPNTFSQPNLGTPLDTSNPSAFASPITVPNIISNASAAPGASFLSSSPPQPATDYINTQNPNMPPTPIDTTPIANIPPTPIQQEALPAQPTTLDTSAIQAALSPGLPPQQPNDNAPTDLTHLIDQSTNVSTSATYTPPTSQQPETLVVPNGSEPGAPAEVQERKPVPKWVIGLGVALLIVVAAASAYFIMGIGQPVPQTSLPAQQTTQQPQLQAPPSTVPQPSVEDLGQQLPTPDSGLNSFGEIENSASAPATASARPSAADLIRQRQLQGE